MAKLHITEFSNLQNAVGVGHAQESAQLPMLPPVAQQVVTFTTTTQSAALNASTRFVWVVGVHRRPAGLCRGLRQGAPEQSPPEMHLHDAGLTRPITHPKARPARAFLRLRATACNVLQIVPFPP